jgi:hypothetical protein
MDSFFFGSFCSPVTGFPDIFFPMPITAVIASVLARAHTRLKERCASVRQSTNIGAHSKEKPRIFTVDTKPQKNA